MPVMVDKINLPSYPNEVTFNFAERVNFFSLENHSFYNIECFFDDETEPITLEKKKHRKFDFACSKIKFKSYAETSANIDILSVFGEGFFDLVDNETETPHLLRIFKKNEVLKEMVFKTLEIFDPSFTLSVGTFSDNEAMVRKNLIKTKEEITTKIVLFEQFIEYTEIFLFFYGGLSAGKMLIYTE